MKLSDDERAMLAGEAGRARQWAIKHQIAVGDFFDAADFVPVAQAHIMADTESLGESGVRWLEELAALPKAERRVRIPTITDPRGLDLESYKRLKQTDAMADLETRAIRAFEALTGVTVLIDDTPGAVVLSGFDPVRREIAREAMQRLILDGRIHPTRIEELVSQVTRDINERIQKDGQAAILETNIRGLHPKVVEAMGKLAFRTSYGQNVLRHSVEVAFLCQMIADATNRPVVAGPVEATAIGNLLVQLSSREGAVDLRAVRAVVRDTFEIARYEPRDAARWKARLG